MISNRQVVMPKCKVTVTFHFLALSRALQEFQYCLKIPKGFLNFAAPHSVLYMQIPPLLLCAYILHDKPADFFVYCLEEISIQIWTPVV